MNPTVPRTSLAFLSPSGSVALVVPAFESDVGQANEAIHQYENRTASVALVSYTTLATTLDLTKTRLHRARIARRAQLRTAKSIVEQRAQRFGRKKPPASALLQDQQGC